MKKHIILGVMIFFQLISFSQIDTNNPIRNTDIIINTAGSPKSVNFVLDLNFTNGYEADTGSENDIKSFLIVGEQKIQLKPRLTRTNIQFILNFDNESMLQQLDYFKSNFYIELDKDFTFDVWKNGDNNSYQKVTVFTVQKIKEITQKSKTKLSDKEEKELIDSKGGTAIISDNSIDIGHVSESESASGNTEVTVNFKYRGYYKNSNSIGYSYEGLLSTDSKDSINYFSAYPFVTSLLNNNGEKVIRDIDVIGKVGIEGNQTLTNYRISADVSIQGLLPNFIDLTAGENRLRLRPTFNLGLKFYNEIENNRRVNTDNEISNQIFADLYYYIPIHNSFSLTFNGKAFYDINKRINPDKKLNYNFDATLGFLVTDGFKTVFKYTKGDNNVTFETGDFFSIGVLTDLVSTFKKQP